MGIPLSPKYIPYTYMDPLGKPLTLHPQAQVCRGAHANPLGCVEGSGEPAAGLGFRV